MTEILDSDQASAFLKLAKVTLYKYVRTGEIPAFKMGRVWKFHRTSLEKWIEGKVLDDTNERAKAKPNKRGTRG
jgi:excisionase family DNA binding protein